MSRNEWEEGTIRIPSAQWAGFKATLQKAATTYCQRLYDESQVFWKLLPSRAKNNSKVYTQWVDAYIYGNVQGSIHHHYTEGIPTIQPRFRRNSWGEIEDDIAFELSHLLTRTLRQYVEGKGWVDEKPRRILRTDLPFPTNKTLAYECAGDGSIRLDPKNRTAHWAADGNHGCESAREHPMGQAFFKALDAVRWTRGSGGDIIGNDEYASEARYEGGGANYSTGSYGPKTKQRTRY